METPGKENATPMVFMCSDADTSGKNIAIGATNYTYYQALPNYYNGGVAPPLTFTNCETTAA